jgi:hypothetical protein
MDIEEKGNFIIEKNELENSNQKLKKLNIII